MPSYLAFNLNDGNEFIFELLEERLSFGRNPSNEIVLDNNQISSFHAEFTRQPSGAYLLADLKSSNGTFVNGRRIESAELKSGDRVRFGQIEARFRDMFIPGPGRKKEGPAPSAEEKRRAAESSGGPKSRTDFIPLADKPKEPEAAVGDTAKGRPIAPATESLHKPQAALQLEQVKLEAQIKATTDESARQRNLFESKKLEVEQTLSVRREQLKVVEHDVTELETRRAEAEKRLKEVSEAGGHLKSTTEELQRVVEQKSAAEAALVTLKATHEVEQNKFNDTTTSHAGVRRQYEEAKVELSRLQDELSATEKRAAAARARAAEEEGQFTERQAGLQKSQSSKIQEFDATLAAKQTAVEVADRRLRELESRRADLESKTAELVEKERTLANLRHEISGQESKRAELASIITELATARSAHEAEMGTISAGRERRESRLAELAAREQDLRTSTDVLQKEIEAGKNFSARRNELEQAIAEKENSLRSLEERIAQLVRREQELTLKLQALPATDSRLDEATKIISQLEQQKDALERAVATLERQREEKEREIAGLAERGAAQHSLLQTLTKQNAWLEESVATRNRRVEAANKYLAGIDSRAADIEAKSAAQQAELENAQTAVTRAAADLESLRNEIKLAAAVKEELLVEHETARSRLHELTKLLADTAVRHREAVAP